MGTFLLSFWKRIQLASLILRLNLLHVASSPVPASVPGVVVVQIDGLGYTVLSEAMRRGAAPFLRWLTKRGFTFHRYFCTVPSITTAIDAELIYGKNDGIPGYSWFHRGLGRFIRGDNGTQVKELEKTMFSDVTRPLLSGGSCILGGYSGGATMTNFSPDAQAIPSPIRRYWSYRLLLAPLLNPFRFFRIIIVLLSYFVAISLRAIYRRSKKKFNDEFWALINRMFLLDLATKLAVIDIQRSTPALFINLSLVDSVSHTHGIQHPIVYRSIHLVDLYCKKLYNSARTATRPYQFVVLSDHGQSPGIPFEHITGETLTELLTRSMGKTGPEVLVTYGNNKNLKENTSRDMLYAVPSSSIAHLYFSRYLPKQARYKTLKHDFPTLIPTLLTHPGIGWIMVRQDAGTTLLLTPRGARAVFKNGKLRSVFGKPMKDPDATKILEMLGHLSECKNIGDIVLFGGNYQNAWTSFEPYVGTHGGFTGEMIRPFIISDNPTLVELLNKDAGMKKLFAAIRGMRG